MHSSGRFIAAAILPGSLALSACSGQPGMPASSFADPRAQALAQSTLHRGAFIEPEKLAKGLTVLYAFKGYPDGANPGGGVLVDKNGAIFGTTYSGGSGQNGPPGWGTVYELAPSGGTYAETILDAYTGADGAWSTSSPIQDASGDLFVTTQAGGPSGSNGTATELSPAGGGYGVAASYGFPSDGGLGPWGPPLLQGSTLYVASYTTYVGSQTYQGGIYALSTPGLGATNLYVFKGPPNDGAMPTSALVADAKGTLYGTTVNGGSATACANGCGTVFSFVPSKSGGTEKVLWSFQGGKSGGKDGAFPYGGVVVDSEGNLYGTTSKGGANGEGTIFELTPSGKGYKEKILHTFSGGISGGPDGGSPLAGVTLKGTTLYGTTSYGGAGSACACGTIYKIGKGGAGYAVLHSFSGSDGSLPEYGALTVEGTALYGTTELGGISNADCAQGSCGEVYRFVP